VGFTQDEWDALLAKFPPGTPVSGVVSSCQVFGVFVRLDELPDVSALLEIIHFKTRETEPERISFPTITLRSGSESRPAFWAGASVPKMCGSPSSAISIGVTGTGWPLENPDLISGRPARSPRVTSGPHNAATRSTG
jgi:hypothetical protein